MTRTMLVFAIAALSGCAHFGADADDCDGLTARLDRLKDQVETEIGEAGASEVAACRTIAFGDKPCGGPWTYLVYSAESSDVAELQRLVADYNRLDEQRNVACELASTCDLTPEPRVVLENGRCVADYSGG